jgi:transposase-like protein
MSRTRRSGDGYSNLDAVMPATCAGCGSNRPTPWHLDEMVIRIQGRHLYLWRAVDSEGEILDMLVQSRRDKGAALRLMRKLLKKHGFAPKVLVTDKLRSYAAARPPRTNGAPATSVIGQSQSI